MYTKRMIIICCICFICLNGYSQGSANAAAADVRSLQLYNEGKWKELLLFGKSEIASGDDFPLLRMRTGYAAFILRNYSESLKHYANVYDKDPSNATALYYVYLDNIYLDNVTASRYYASKMPGETRASLKIDKSKLSALGLEYSYKVPDIAERGNAQYGRVGLNFQLGYKLELQQSVSFYNQLISEQKLTAVTNNRNINIAQREYYGKVVYALGGNTALLGGFHYLYIPFNNYIYNNVVGFAGIKYSTPYVALQAQANISRIRDTSYNQVDGVVTIHPTGNTGLYSISKVSFGKELTFIQVLGFKIVKNTWIEGNITVGEYKVLMDHDALYVFDDIDTKKFKAGGSLYLLLAKKVLFSLNYTFEKKQRYGTTNIYFHQQSTTGGLQWNF